MPKANARSVGANVLGKMTQAGIESVVLQQRARYAVAAQARNQYIGPLSWCRCGHPHEAHGYIACEVQMYGCTEKGCRCTQWERVNRVHPHYLPTQASGRWSTTEPPIPNFPKACLRVDCPHPKPHAPVDENCWEADRVFLIDPGEYTLTWDKDAIEARVNAVLTEDVDMIKAFVDGLDLHTINACHTFGLPLPSNLVDPHKSPEDAPWRELVSWGLKEDLRRRTQKVITFGTFYGPDETAVLGAKGVEELGISREELLERTRIYLNNKPCLLKAKERYWTEFIKNPIARTYWGRRLQCYPTRKEKEDWLSSLGRFHAGKGSMKPGDAQKKLWNFLHQGFVAGHINRTIIAIKRRWPEARLVYNKHDSLKFAFPFHINPWPEIREIDEVTCIWPNGLSMKFTSTWKREGYTSGKHVEYLR